MFGRILIALMVVSFISSGVVAGVEARQKKVEERSKFYDFPDQLIDGGSKQPAVIYAQGRQGPTFERLLKLRKALLPLIHEACGERALK